MKTLLATSLAWPLDVMLKTQATKAKTNKGIAFIS